jgi:hypothetical protein
VGQGQVPALDETFGSAFIESNGWILVDGMVLMSSTGDLYSCCRMIARR